MKLLMLLACALNPPQEEPKTGLDVDEVRVRLKDPSQVFPIFQELLRAGRYANAWEWTLSPKTRSQLPYEAFYTAMTVPEMSYDVSKRLMNSLRVHKADPESRVLRLCGSQFGFDRELRLSKFVNLWVLDLTRDELESFVKYFAGRAMAWHRLQVKRADGWHYAYPPDWTYAPVARSCVCGK